MSETAPDPDFVDGLVQLSFRVQSELAAAAARHDVTVPQVRLMGILRDREPGMQALAGHLGLDKSSVTGLVDRAERRGLVQRVSDAEDGRSIRVRATPLGRRLTTEVGTEIAGQISRLGQVLTQNQRQALISLVRRILGTD